MDSVIYQSGLPMAAGRAVDIEPIRAELTDLETGKRPNIRMIYEEIRKEYSLGLYTMKQMHPEDKAYAQNQNKK